MEQQDVLYELFLFHGLTKKQIATLLEQLPPPVTYAKGDCIYDVQSFDRSLGILLCGTVLVQSPQDNGHPLLLNRLSVGNVFGAAALFGENSPQYVTVLTALDTVRVQFITQEQLSAWFTTHPILAQNYIAFLSDRVRFLNRKLDTVTNGSSVSRLYHYCLSHATPNGTVTLPHNMTALAESLNMGRSSLYRSFDTLVKTGLLQKNGKIFLLKQ